MSELFRLLLAQMLGYVREVNELADKVSGNPKKPAVYSINWEKV